MNFDEPLLTAADESSLARTIEVGVLASAVLRGQIPMIAGATSVELSSLVRAGEQARERFLLANCRLVFLEAQKVALRLDLNVDELFQEGFLGLSEAVSRFDYQRGCRFATYALPWIRERLSSAARTRCGQIHASAWTIRKYGFDVIRTVSLTTDVVSLVEVQNAVNIADTFPSDDIGLARMLRCLPKDQRIVLQRRYGATQATLVELAQEMGISVSTVRRIHDKAIVTLRGRFAADIAA
ncbi:MAG: sigma-70 family RNA polymerase sigma factor [Propionibacteriaceae bacterium]